MIREVLTTPNHVLRQKSQRLEAAEVKTKRIRQLVADIQETIASGEYGVGMSAVQVGEPFAVSVVMIRPTPNRPDLKPFNKTYFNAEIISVDGDKTPMWEGCCSVVGDDNRPVYAKVLRYPKIQVKYLDENGLAREDWADGFLAHVLQHEIDHLDGILFTDLVEASDIISYDEYHQISKKQ
ncbi:peptide deformylase [Candidatus Saccharibacteria bacterium]|nr:peptide deformylase [Candidatus Saccharibacteria bacterium]